MVDAHQRSQWMHTAALLAQMHNTSGFAKDAKQPKDYPFDPDEKIKPSGSKLPLKDQIATLKSRWLKTYGGG